MLINNSQLRRLREALPKGSKILIGKAPEGNRRSEGSGWSKEMDGLQHKYQLVEKINLIEQAVMADGSIKYDVDFIIQDAATGALYHIMPEWAESDPKIRDILAKPAPDLKISIVKNEPAKTTTKPKTEGTGFLATAAGAFLAAVGVAAIRAKKTKQKSEVVEEEKELIKENQFLE